MPAIKNNPRIVIVGCGFGGLEAARALRDAAVDISLVDRTNHHAGPGPATGGRFGRNNFLIGFRNRIVVLIDWASAYWSRQRYARVITDIEPPTQVAGTPHG